MTMQCRIPILFPSTEVVPKLVCQPDSKSPTRKCLLNLILPDAPDGGVGVVALCVVGGGAGDERREARRARQARPEVRRPEVRRPPQALRMI